jgi:sulfite reductase (NADPH) flavoprotein alpha-component
MRKFVEPSLAGSDWDLPMQDSSVGKSTNIASEYHGTLPRTSSGLASRIVAWLSQLGKRSTATNLAEDARQPVGFFYASQTGNAENLARDAASLAENLGLKVVLSALDEIDVYGLSSFQHAVFFVSTYGEGDMPDNGQLLWDGLSAQDAPALHGFHFAVLSLGDSSYRDFCRAGKRVDACLEALGATRLQPLLTCDVDFEQPATAWINQLLAVISGENADAVTALNASSPVSEDRHNFVHVKLAERRRLSGTEAEKPIHHVEFDLANTGLVYAVGDAVGIKPVNDAELVSAVITWLGVKPDTLVEGRPLDVVLAHEREIRNPGPDLMRAIAERTSEDDLRSVWHANDIQALGDFFRGGDVVDVLSHSPPASLSADELISLLKPLQHRNYSISSSPLVAPTRVHITVGAVRYTRGDRIHRGVCSTFLADRLTDEAGADLVVLPNKNFRLPKDPTTPLIMIGPGTGIAPFRAFLQERRATGATGRNWLFFGNRNCGSDFIYRDEILAYEQDGFLTRLDLAFSRDQPKKIYVQTRMRERGAELYDWLEQGAAFYVCGDASRMARDVDDALVEIIAQHGGLSATLAQDYVARMKRDKRYLRDVY